MFVRVYKSTEQRQLYFDLKWMFQKSNGLTKTIGVYAIYNDDICVYVGQSKNIASRLATHLSGRYKKATKILVFEDLEYVTSPESDTEMLIETEKYLIKKLSPIENILADHTIEINNDNLMSQFCDMEKGAPISFNQCSEYKIINYGCTLEFSDYGDGGEDEH